jgi:uncharacterized membrane protein YgaE (UPF0421/DUF939 family)
VSRATDAGLERLRLAEWRVLQCSVAAMIAWLLATEVVGHHSPFFAPIAAIITLGLTDSERLRRMIELAAGVTIGVAIGDLLVQWIGTGWWQIGLVVALAMGLAQLLFGGGLITAQAGVQAIFLVAVPQLPGTGLARWEDALVGGACALLVAALLPSDPSRAVRTHAQLMITELASVAADAATALRARDAAAADAVLDRARNTQDDLERWTEALIAGEEISRISPIRRRRRFGLARFRVALVGLDRATRNVRVAVRRIAAVLDHEGPPPDALPGILDELAAALLVLGNEVASEPGRSLAVRALEELAGRLDPVALGARTMSETVIVAQLRSAVVDLLGATGMDEEHARALLPPI